MVTFCRNDERKDCTDLGIGEYIDFDETGKKGLKSDITGIYFPSSPEVKVIAYTKANYGGKSQVFTHTIKSLDQPFRNDIGSAKIVSAWIDSEGDW